MIQTIVFKANEVAMSTTANTFTTNANGSAYAPPQAGAGNAKMTCRIVNLNSNSFIITLANTTFSGNLQILGNTVIFLSKNLTDTVNTNATGANASNILLGVVGFTY